MFVEDTLIPMSGFDSNGNAISWSAVQTNTIDLKGGITDTPTQLCDICHMPRREDQMVKNNGRFYCYLSGCVNDLQSSKDPKRR